MSFRDLLGKELLFFDGGLGTMLQAQGLLAGEAPDIWCMTRPDAVRDIHLAYLRAGCDIVSTNTFGCTDFKLKDTGYCAREVAAAAVACAKEAIAMEKRADKCFAALDIGPTGKLLAPIGDLQFEDAVSAFGATVRAGAEAGADLVLIETMSDMYELKAAVLAAKENSSLPVIASVTFNREGRLLTGGDIHAVTALLEGLRVDALGMNCGLGPGEMIKLLRELREICSLPILVMPNAGIPRSENGRTVFDVAPQEFAASMREAHALGAQLFGGCCGTTPAHIRALTDALRGEKPLPVAKKSKSVISSYSKAVYFDGPVVVIGERINPTGKPRMKQALLARDFDYVLCEGIAQQEQGAQVLDVNAGVPGIDEREVLKELTVALQSVLDLPLQLDTAKPEALSGALRFYNGKPMINSVNGKEESMRAVFPLAKKYGALIVALTLDESGIPETVQGRVDVARKIIELAGEYGIDRKDIVIDALTMAVSAGKENPCVTLETLRRIKSELNVKTILGVSNVSFGLPGREFLNAAFFTMAMAAGLDGAIINPHSIPMMQAYKSARALLGQDESCEAYIAYQANVPAQAPSTAAPVKGTLKKAVLSGLKLEAFQLAQEALETREPLGIIENELVPALNAVGEGFEKGTLFLPQLLMSADAAKSAFEAVKAKLGASAASDKGCVVVATVQGDVHDIGKNIARAMLENYRFRVIDLGKDVPPERVVEAARVHGAKLVGLSALMTTTVDSMKRTIELLKQELPACKVMAGGAVLSEEYALLIGADKYVKDAMAGVHYAQEVYARQN